MFPAQVWLKKVGCIGWRGELTINVMQPDRSQPIMQDEQQLQQPMTRVLQRAVDHVQRTSRRQPLIYAADISVCWSCNNNTGP